MLRKGTSPLYHQLREILTQQIESGEWRPGHRLPTEAALSAEFGVSRVTVRQAMQLLETQGLVERIQGKGTFVGRPKVAHNLLSMSAIGGELRRSDPQLLLHHVQLVAPQASVSDRLGLATNEMVYELRRSIIADGEPLMLITSWLPALLFPHLEDEQLETESIRRVVRNRYGIEAGIQHKEVEVTIVDGEEARLLQVRSGSPALLVSYLSRTKEGLSFEYRKMIVRGDRCKYYVDLEDPELLM